MAQPSAFSLRARHEPLPDARALPRRPHGNVVEKQAAPLLNENQDANNPLIAIDHEHAVIADDLVVAVQHGSRRFADALDIRRIGRCHAFRNTGRIAGEGVANCWKGGGIGHDSQHLR